LINKNLKLRLHNL